MIDQIIELIIPHLSYSLYRDEPMTTDTTELKSLTEVTDAQKIIRDGIMIQSNEKIASKCVRLHDAYGKILLTDIYAKCNVPSFKTSAINGFAVKANDKKNRKKILEAGSTFLEPGTCVRVKTGAFIPDEATAVIKIKNTEIVSNNNTWEEIEIIIQPKEGENIKPIGCEIKMGNKILGEHTYIGLAEIELLASCGINEVEIIESQTKDFDTLDFGIVDADMLKMSIKVQEALKDVNILVITGFANGRDQLKTILQNNFNANIYFDRVNMKPGKSTTYGTCMLGGKQKHILYLSGNSATILITAHLFLLPLLNKMHYNDMEVPVIHAHVMDEYKKYSRPNYIWTHLKWDKEETFARVSNTYANNNLLRAHNANALLIVPAASGSDKSLSPGTLTPVLFLGSKSFCQNIPN
ncbi:gephyrin-like [Camponotus floridanus]|uniref:gephyrin-like n=1 Tax=Camponotus floridanus TaxID=104421 RepID=UPI000DC6A6D0|nr:gephyrin-like [Camponotus floridanus]